MNEILNYKETTSLTLDDLATEWIRLKKCENEAIELRRAVEDSMRSMANLAADFTGTETIDIDEYVIKIVGSLTRKVDSDLLQAVAKEFGLSSQLPVLFRWKPEVNMKEWAKADELTVNILSRAITSKPSRPTLGIYKKSEK